MVTMSSEAKWKLNMSHFLSLRKRCFELLSKYVSSALLVIKENSENSFYADIQYNDEIRDNGNLTVTKPSLKR